MTNEIVGIVSAIGLTFFLFGLRHLILPSNLPAGRTKKDRRVTPTAQHENHEPNMKIIEDDAWLLWMPDFEIEPRAGRGEGHKPRGERRTASTRDERLEDRTMGGEIR